MVDLSKDDIIEKLGLEPHPEGGFYRETFRDRAGVDGARSYGTAIYYLLGAEDRSQWHQVDASEIWHWYGGGPLELSMRDDEGDVSTHVMGIDFARGEAPQVVVPAYVWQSARPVAGWVLMGCTVAPGFEFSGFEMAADGDWSR